MSDSRGANRIELECQVLCSALRYSWSGGDVSGRAKSCLELSQLFPDLLTDFESTQGQRPVNNYELLDIACDVSPSKVVVAYFRQAKKFLRENNPRQKRAEYYQLLTAGFVLRKPRLRLSHDMIVSRANLQEQKVIRPGSFEMIETAPPVAPPTLVPDSAPGTLPQPVAQPQAQAQAPARPAQPVPPAAQAPPQRLPAVIELLKAAQLIAAPEVLALTNQMRSFPGVSVVELILSAGYVTEGEMKSVQLGEFLLGQGKINLGQFCVAMYDERAAGVKMAESLQSRGWLKAD